MTGQSGAPAIPTDQSTIDTLTTPTLEIGVGVADSVVEVNPENCSPVVCRQNSDKHMQWVGYLAEDGHITVVGNSVQGENLRLLTGSWDGIQTKRLESYPSLCHGLDSLELQFLVVDLRPGRGHITTLKRR